MHALLIVFGALLFITLQDAILMVVIRNKMDSIIEEECEANPDLLALTVQIEDEGTRAGVMQNIGDAVRKRDINRLERIRGYVRETLDYQFAKGAKNGI